MSDLISFKYRQFKKDIILMLIRWYLAYSLSNYSTQLEESFRKNHKRHINSSYRVDETYLKIKGKDFYIYRAVDKLGKQLISNCLKSETSWFNDYNEITPHQGLKMMSPRQFLRTVNGN